MDIAPIHQLARGILKTMLPIYETFYFSSTLDIAKGGLKGLLFILLIGLLPTPASAILSDKTGQIQGQVPTVTGIPQVLLPDGVTVLADNAILEGNQSPDQFKISTSIADLILHDADGDAELSALVDTAHATLTWMHNGTELSPAQLATPFGENFAAQTLTLEVSVPVTASSSTGLPTTAEPKILFYRYIVYIPSKFTGVTVNGHTFEIDAGFPSVGFSKATFTLDMTGNPDDYIWNSNQASNVVTINNSGQVTLESQPTSAAITIMATPKNGSRPLAYSFNIKSWFSPPGINIRNDSVVQYCNSRKLVLPTRAQLTSGENIRQVGTLFGEWGNMLNYSGGFTNVTYWTADIGPSASRYFGSLVTGNFSASARTSELAIVMNVTCMNSI
ncbi:hypothetical protein ACQ86O_27575 (plasmid) [Serratia sp. L9]|uniref:hypothetical protein n=1 Tax=Serratia sp. L9 TaxID=3423946 RepID=UPI003D67F444